MGRRDKMSLRDLEKKLHNFINYTIIPILNYLILIFKIVYEK